MNLNKAILEEKSKELGFSRDTFEKVIRLTNVLEFMNTHPTLKENLVLKGGTAINLTVFDLPRLSVDIDMDLAVNYSLEKMTEIREEITDIIQNFMQVNGYTLNANSKYRHSLDSMVFSYTNAGGNFDNLKVEINYSLRSHVFESEERHIVPFVTNQDILVKTLNVTELFAAKLNALMSRAAVRDLYDIDNMIRRKLYDETDFEMLRKCTVFYAAISATTINKNFSTDAIDFITINKVKRELFPVIGEKEHFNLDEKKLNVKTFINSVMQLTDKEAVFLERFENKEYMPELLFEDDEIIKRVIQHPMALWKMR